VRPEGFRAGLERLTRRYDVVYDEGMFQRDGFLAGNDERRAEELNSYLRDPDIRAIVCARGGYGVMRILDRLDADALRRDPKVIVGFSDITALAGWAIAAGVRPIHGPMLVQLARLPEEDLDWLFKLLETATAPGPVPAQMTRTGARGGGTIEGRLIGGNLEIVTRLIGTPYAFDTGASVLFCEEVGERPYRVDRMLTQMKLAGALDGVRAVVAGDFIRCDEPDGTPPTVQEVIAERLESFDIPGVIGLPIGHAERNLALPVGASCALDLATATLVLEEAAVS
jgi:muramoyltetrapeptide carboxypeptidase